MANNDVKEIDKYCYNITLDAIQYSNDTLKWSPNNIRRLILSPDGVVVQLHTGKTLIKKPFIREKAYVCFSSTNYKPMITALVNRVCSSIEEIIFCTGSSNGLFLPESELALKSILASNKVFQSDEVLIKHIADRFVRLRGILIFNYTVTDFLNRFSSLMIDHTTQLSDMDNIANEANVINIHKDDWYKHYYLRPKDYSFDKEDGVLYSTLHKVESVIDKDKHDSALADSKNKRLKESIEKVKASESKTLRVLKMYKDIASLILNCNVVCIYSNEYDSKILPSSLFAILSKYKFYDSEKVLSKDFINIVLKYGAKYKTDKNGDVKESLQSLAGNLDSLFLELYVSICNNFLDIIIMSGTKYPIMTTLKLKQYDRVIYIPPQLVEKAKLTDKYFVEPLSGSSIKDSLANICCLITFILLSDAGENGATVKKYSKKQAWLNKYKDLEVIKNE